MSARRNGKPTIVERDMEISYAGRRGRVCFVRSESADILWEEHVDPETGEVIGPRASSMTHAEIRQADLRGALRILRRPRALAEAHARNILHRTAKEQRRQAGRLAYAEAADALVNAGQMGTTRQAFLQNSHRLIGDGLKLDHDRSVAKRGEAQGRGGRVIKKVDLFKPPKNGATIHEWWLKYKRGGKDALFDNYAVCGRRGDRYSPEVVELVRSIVDSRLDEERPSVASIHESVEAAFDAERKRRAANSVEGEFPTPGYDYVHDVIDRLAPIDHKIRTRGFVSAYAHMHPLGLGVQLTRALERVEIDEYIVDLMVFLTSDSRLLAHLPPEVLAGINLDGRAARLRVSAARDGYTGCLLALKITPERGRVMLSETLEMILTDKSFISDGVGAMSAWSQHGIPELVCLDRDPGYASDEAADLLAALGIINFGPPSRKPWLRPFIERFFRTYHSTFLQRLSGRTFGNTVERGANDPAQRASIKLDDFLAWTARWIVDIYHNTTPKALGSIAPAVKWAEATAAHEVMVPSKAEMRLVFGVRDTRKLSPKGIRVNHIDYQSDALAAHFLGKPVRGPLEVAWWGGDIGAVEVRLSGDSWVTVPSADPFWHGKTLNDLLVLQARGRELNKTLQDIKLQAINELDQFSLRRKALLGLTPVRVETPEQLRSVEQHLMRFMVTGERLNRAPEPRDLFGDVVEPASDAMPDPSGIPPTPSPETPPRHAEDPDDIME